MKYKQPFKFIPWSTSHTSQEPGPWNCESPKGSVQRLSQTHLHVLRSRALRCSVKSYVCSVRSTSHTSQEPCPWNCESPKGSVQRLSQTHLHVLWSRALRCSVESYVTGPSTKCYFNEFLFMRVLTYDKIKSDERSECHVSRFCVRLTSKRWYLKIIQVTKKHDPFDVM